MAVRTATDRETISTIATPVEQLDLATVIEVSQAVSGEMVLERLLDTLMRIAIAQTGATRGLLILSNAGEPRIAVEATTGNETIHVELRNAPLSASDVPATVLHHVLHSRESIVLDNAATHMSFAADPYVRDRRLHSILCLPLISQAKLIGVLYLEDKLTPRVFAPARIAVLKLLASQAAIAIENIRLYRELAERESKIRRLVDANIIGIFVWEIDGRILDANDAFLRMLGYDRDDVTSGQLRWTEITPSEWLDRDLQQRLPDIKAAGSLQPFEKEFFHKDGGRVPVLIGAAIFEGNSNDGVAFVLDLSERKQAELALRKGETKIRLLFDANIIGCFIGDVEGRYVWDANDAFLHMLGYDREDVVSGRVSRMKISPPDWHEHDARTLAELKRSGRVKPFQREYLRKDGSRIPALVGATVFEGDRFFAFALDLSEQKSAEIAARRSERQLRDVIETIPAMAWTTLPSGARDFANHYWSEFAGASSEDAAGAGWEGSHHPADIASHLAKWRISLATGKPFENEARLRRARDGEFRWFLHRAVPLRDEGGNVLKWYGISTDIDDRKRAEAFLTGAKRILEMVAKADSLPHILDGLCRLVEEQDGGVLATILLLEGDRLRHGAAPSLPRAYTDAIDGNVIGPSVGSCGTAAYRGEQVIVEDIASDPLWAVYRAAALSHSLRACWSTPIFSSQGKVIATFGMYYREPRRPSPRDQQIIEQITHLAGVAIERKLIQEALRRSESHLAEAQRLSHTGSWAVRPGVPKPLYWSDEMFRIWGFDPEQGPPDNEAAWQRIHPEDRKTIAQEQMERAIAGTLKVDTSIESRIILPDGTLKHVHRTCHPAFDGAGNVVEYIGTTVDVTARKHAEEALRNTQMELTHANRVAAMGQLTASIAHEVNQPIAAARNNAASALRFLSRNPPDLEEVRAALECVVNDADRAGEIIKRIKAQVKKSPPRRASFDINEAINELVALTRSEVVEKRVTVRSRLAEGLSSVRGDRVQLQQVILNLILNAVEAMSSVDNPRRELSISTERAGADEILVAVRDSGPGIDPEYRERVFDSFYTTKPSGMGLGLSICRSIVEAHGGRLWAAANEPRGAVFQFMVPLDSDAAR